MAIADSALHEKYPIIERAMGFDFFFFFSQVGSVRDKERGFEIEMRFDERIKRRWWKIKRV